jgi:hypothetical protein
LPTELGSLTADDLPLALVGFFLAVAFVVVFLAAVLTAVLVFVVLESELLVVIYRRCFSDSDVMHATDLFYFSL